MLAADWNATPNEVRATGWCTEVGGMLSSTGMVTCTAREVDFLVFSACLQPMIIGTQAILGPYKPHACIRLGISRCAKDMLKWTIAKPKQFPSTTKELLGSSDAAAAWTRISAAAGIPTTSDRVIIACTKEVSMSVAAAAEAARDEIEQVQLDESCRWQLEYESTSEGSHPFLSHLPTPMRKSAQMVHQELLRWTTTWESWMTEVLVHNPDDHFRYKGRGTEPRWKQVKVADDRSSPVKGIHVPADMGKAERACECLRT